MTNCLQTIEQPLVEVPLSPTIKEAEGGCTDRLRHYFPDLSAGQMAAFGRLGALYAYWNARINVISRADISNLYEHHVLHSLAIAKAVAPVPGTSVLDLGCGGGFPGIPLAIVWPQVQFTLIDGTRKKIAVAQAVAMALGLTNVECRAQRAEQLRGETFDLVVTRGVAALPQLIKWARPLAPRLIALKGQPVETVRQAAKICVKPISQWFSEPWFQEKVIVDVQWD